MKRVCLIIPAFNERESLPKLLYEIRSIDFLKGFNIHTVVINDGSTDDTKNIITENDVTLLSLISNLGIGGAVQTGLIYAKENGYNIAIQVDGDGQHPPTEINKLLAIISENNNIDLVIGSRYLTSEGYQSSFMRRLGINLFSLIIKLLTKKRYYDTTSGFRLINERALSYFADNYPDDFPEPESLVMSAMLGLKIEEVQVIMNYREKGKSSITSIKSIYFMLKVLLSIIFIFIRTKYEIKNGITL